ncbi:COG3650 family protein [Aurantiacibacter luteus]|uniref:Lipoprotein n=1 Tax=Aurantiacibacter luteus TaxID=1581420 RepID=A0A0G9MVF8_9SPHN|nr:hypothetical protein [Aurantiacibacter luteus]KLE34747.1 hypothetical protein AAW00_11405 [Aurantiacibacter luteus]
MRQSFLLLLTALLAACGTGSGTGTGQDVPGDGSDSRPYAGIAEGAVLRLVGTEPFWGGTIAGGTFTYTTPENQAGEAAAVTRFAGRGGLSFSGTMGARQLDLVVTPGACSDGMSDRTYPFVATLQLGGEQRQGCAWREGDDLGAAP